MLKLIKLGSDKTFNHAQRFYHFGRGVGGVLKGFGVIFDNFCCNVRQDNFCLIFRLKCLNGWKLRGINRGSCPELCGEKKTSTHFFFVVSAHPLIKFIFQSERGQWKTHKTFCSAWFARSTYTWWMLCDDWLIGFFEPMLKLDFWQ